MAWPMCAKGSAAERSACAGEGSESGEARGSLTPEETKRTFRRRPMAAAWGGAALAPFSRSPPPVPPFSRSPQPVTPFSRSPAASLVSAQSQPPCPRPPRRPRPKQMRSKHKSTKSQHKSKRGLLGGVPGRREGRLRTGAGTAPDGALQRLPRAAAAAAATSGSVAPAISLTEKALKHLNRMRTERNEDLCLRIGVKQGGCSGMSYTMEFENRTSANPEDSFIEYDGFAIVCDPKSLLFMFEMELDYSDALIGGGFNFENPNATKTCGCGKSFATNKETENAATACNN